MWRHQKIKTPTVATSQNQQPKHINLLVATWKKMTLPGNKKWWW
jgi:hypothetical protein